MGPSSGRLRRYLLDPADGGAVERSSAALSGVPNVSPAIHKMVQKQGARTCPPTDDSRPQTTRESRPYRGFYRRLKCRSKKRGLAVGRTRGGLATKIMAITDARGLPISAGIAGGEKCEARLATKAVEACFSPTAPVKLVDDKAYDSDPLDAELAERNVEMIAPNRRSRVRRTQDGRPLRRYRRRWIVERFFAWLKRERRIALRWEFRALLFKGFLQLGCLEILLRQLREGF